MNKADQRDFDSHYEYWDKIKGINGGEMKETKRCCGVEQGQPHLKGCPTGQKITEPLIVFTTDYILQGTLREFDDLYDLCLEISS